MASIVFEGPDVLDLNKRTTTVVDISDDAMVAIVQAFCELENYSNNIEPVLFTVNKTIEFCKQKMEYNARRKVREIAENSVKNHLEFLKDSIKISKEGGKNGK